MKLIGLLGGISPVSTKYYYDLLNERARARLGARHSARCLIHTVDFAVVEACQVRGDWPGVTKELQAAARSLEAGGAGCLILACNTMHHVAETVASAVEIPFLHIGDAAAAAVKAAGHRRVGLLGTRFTMQAAFLRKRLEAAGIEVVVPDAEGRRFVHDVIYDELCEGRFRPEDRQTFLDVIGELAKGQGADAVVLGCTEIGLLLGDAPLPIPAFDTSRTHVDAAHAWAFT